MGDQGNLLSRARSVFSSSFCQQHWLAHEALDADVLSFHASPPRAVIADVHMQKALVVSAAATLYKICYSEREVVHLLQRQSGNIDVDRQATCRFAIRDPAYFLIMVGAPIAIMDARLAFPPAFAILPGRRRVASRS